MSVAPYTGNHIILQKVFSLKSIIKITAAGFGSGYSPVAPGSVGTLVGIPLYLLLCRFPWPIQIFGIIALTVIAVYTSGVAERLDFESEGDGDGTNHVRQLVRDPGWIVIDEIAGLQVTLFMVPPTFQHVLAGYLLFRVFDILKVFPANFCETRLSGGWAIVMDDIVAGFYGALVLWFLIKYWGV